MPRYNHFVFDAVSTDEENFKRNQFVHNVQQETIAVCGNVIKIQMENLSTIPFHHYCNWKVNLGIITNRNHQGESHFGSIQFDISLRQMQYIKKESPLQCIIFHAKNCDSVVVRRVRWLLFPFKYSWNMKKFQSKALPYWAKHMHRIGKTHTRTHTHSLNTHG